MIVQPSDGWAVLISSITWATVSVAVGWAATRWSPDRLSRTGPVTTLRRWERNGQFWQRTLRVRAWKDRVPEAGGLFRQGGSMRHVGSLTREGIEGFRRDTIRAERVHWSILASTPIHLVWCRPAIAAGMVAFGVLFNAPFIVVQRYNRGRLDRMLARGHR